MNGIFDMCVCVDARQVRIAGKQEVSRYCTSRGKSIIVDKSCCRAKQKERGKGEGKWM